MINVLSQYLESVRENLRLDLVSENEVIDELQTHIEDEYREMRESGLSEEEAASTCIKLLGSAKLVAHQIYEAHSQGTWKQAILASVPHMLFAAIFTLNWWQGIGWMTVTLGIIFGIAVYGWLHGRPLWLFTWLGYSVLPVLIAGLLLLYLPRGWSWLAIMIYLPLALFLVVFITVKTIKRDWLYCPMMMLPVPIIIGWFLAAGKEGELFELSFEYIGYFAPGIGLTFLALAITVAAFIRLRQRWLKLALLPLSGLLTLATVAFYSEGRLSLPSFIILILIMAGLLLSPALMERRIRYGKQHSGVENVQILD
ncbi:permease prefix domain 1-containing protein [Chloroflexota bacterium]